MHSVRQLSGVPRRATAMPRPCLDWVVALVALELPEKAVGRPLRWGGPGAPVPGRCRRAAPCRQWSIGGHCGSSLRPAERFKRGGAGGTTCPLCAQGHPPDPNSNSHSIPAPLPPSHAGAGTLLSTRPPSTCGSTDQGGCQHVEGSDRQKRFGHVPTTHATSPAQVRPEQPGASNRGHGGCLTPWWWCGWDHPYACRGRGPAGGLGMAQLNRPPRWQQAPHRRATAAAPRARRRVGRTPTPSGSG